MKIADWLLEHSLVYRTWQAPFAARKLAPLTASGDIARARRVLDVGCGPGTSAPQFGHADYVGIDINEAYIDSAVQRYRRRFVAADVTQYSVSKEGKFDFILINSLLHHIETKAVERLLAHLGALLTDDGFIHILELVLPPERWSVAHALARADRGNFPRPLEEWRAIVGGSLDIVAFEPYPLGAAGFTLWKMVYCKARRQ